MDQWKIVNDLHRMAEFSQDIKKKTLEAIEYLKSVFKDYHPSFFTHRHPLGTRLLRASEVDNLWIIQFSEKIKLLITIKGSKNRLKGLTNIKEVYNLWPEIEVALKLKRSLLNVEFIEREMNEYTPDLLLEIGSQKYGIEVTTLNNPEEYSEINEFYFEIQQLSMKYNKKIITGGNIIKRPKDIEKTLQEFKTMIEESIEANTTSIFNKSGFYSIFIAPLEKKEEIPYEFRRGFRFATKEPRDIVDNLISKFKKKENQLKYKNYPSILVIYCGTRCWSVDELLETKGHKIDTVLNTYLNVTGLIFTTHQRWWRSIDNIKKQEMDNKILIELPPALGEYDGSIIWKNELSNLEFPSEIIEAYTNYFIQF